MIRFVGNNSDGLPQKRSQSLRACETCRKRKKRCMHTMTPDGDVSATSHTVTSPSSLATPVSIQQSTSGLSHRLPSSPSLELSSTSNPGLLPAAEEVNDGESDGANDDRFIGDLNPESIFLAVTSPQSTLSPDDDNVGIWLPRKALEGFRKRLSSQATSQSLSADPLLSNILLPYMQRQCQQLLPAPSDYASLHRIYVHEVHSIFPVIDLETLDTNSYETSASTLIIKQAICLAAGASPRGARLLRLPSRGGESNEEDTSDSARQLASAMRTSIDMGFVTDRVVIVQVLTTLALFTQFSHQSDLSAEITARAISHAQTMGLHLDAPNTRKNHEYLTRLFCCVWTIDKLNAAFHGRPTLLHEHDFGRDLNATFMGQEGCFRLLLRVTSHLDATIALYRPAGTKSAIMAKGMPSFEDLIHDCDAVRVPSNLLATMELLYHAVVILSCRTQSSVHGSHPLEIREVMSATNIVNIIGTEFHNQISHIPFAPYALSLSLRVFYRELRFSSKSPFTRNRARKQLLNACSLLRASFADSFPSTMKVAELAEQTVKEMEKVYNSILQQYNNSRSASETADHSNISRVSEGTLPGADDDSQPVTASVAIPFDIDGNERLPDLDVFEFFDSDFQLDMIDAALIDSMALANPPMLDPVSFLQ